jgi:hypothetical protein
MAAAPALLLLAAALLGETPPPSPEAPADGPDVIPTAPSTGDALDHLDAASACLRRALFPCAIAESDAASAAAARGSELRREALRIGATARALSDDPDGAAAAFAALRAEGSSWRPDPDADPRVLAAFRAALRPPPAAPTTPPPPDAPSRPAPPRPFFVSIAAGAGLPIGSRRHEAGLAAALELGWTPAADTDAIRSPRLAITAQLHLAWLPLSDDLAVEPGQSTTLGTLAALVGADLRLPLAAEWDLVLQAGIGGGRFSIGAASSGAAFALHGGAGIRWALGGAFALRAELGPMLFVPFSGVKAAGHPTVLLRAEGSF